MTSHIAGVPSLKNYSWLDCDFQEDSELISIPQDEYAQYLVYKQATTTTCTPTIAKSGNDSHYL